MSRASPVARTVRVCGLVAMAMAGQLAATSADAQYSRGARYGATGQSGRVAQSNGARPPPAQSRPAARRSSPRPAQPLVKLTDIVGIGRVTSIEPESGRITIAYEPIEALNWPAGTTAFAVTKSALLVGLSPGDKIRFKLESQRIAELWPFAPAPAPVEQTAAPVVSDPGGLMAAVMPRRR